MQRTAENAEIQARAIVANELHQRQETLLLVADRVHRQLGAVVGLLWMSSQGPGNPDEASADYRLGEMDATTVGFKFGRDLNERHAWSLRLEQYLQTGEGSPSEAFGQLEQQDLYPDVEALIVQFNYSFKW